MSTVHGTAAAQEAGSGAKPERSGPAPLPAEAAAALARLRDLIAVVRRQTRKWIWIESLTLVGLALAALFWGSMAFDWAVEPPAWVRGLIVGLALLGALAILVRKLWGRLAAPMGDATLATVLERGHVGFRDSLSTSIELAARSRDDVDQRLFERTVQEAAAVADQVDVRSIFRHRLLGGMAFAGALALATVAGLAVLKPAVAGLWTRRMLFLDDTPWPRRTGLVVEGFPDGVRKVARGTDVDLVAKADAAREIPEVVDLRTRPARGGAWRIERMGMRGGVSEGSQAFGHQLKGLTEDLDVEVRGGDARISGLRLSVVDAPALAQLECQATLPAYLGGGTRPVSASRVLQVPRGSTVNITFHSTKPLVAATVVGIVDGLEKPLAEVGPASGDTLRGVSVALDPVEGERTLVARFSDTDGLPNRETISVVLVAIPDEAPQIAVRLQGISTAVTPQARIPLVGVVSDDHALEAAAATVAVKDGPVTILPVGRVRPGMAVVEFTDAAPESIQLAPLGIPVGASLTVQLAARDGCTLQGGPNEGKSDAWSLDVVTPESLMAMLEAREILLRRRFESVVSDLTLARERLAAGDALPVVVESAAADADPAPADGWQIEAGRLAESATRAAGETLEIAAAFRTIRAELDNNALLNEELEGRLVGQIAAPLTALAKGDLPGLSSVARGAAAPDRDVLLSRTDEVLTRMRAVLDKMMELESYNEVIELLRGVIRTQEEIRSETLRRQRQRAREALK